MVDTDAFRRLDEAWARGLQLRAALARTAGEIALTEERTAEVLESVAAVHPRRRDRLHALAADARAFAARERAASQPSPPVTVSGGRPSSRRPGQQ